MAITAKKRRRPAVSVVFASVPLEESHADILLKSFVSEGLRLGWPEMNQLCGAPEVQSLGD